MTLTAQGSSVTWLKVQVRVSGQLLDVVAVGGRGGASLLQASLAQVAVALHRFSTYLLVCSPVATTVCRSAPAVALALLYCCMVLAPTGIYQSGASGFEAWPLRSVGHYLTAPVRIA